MSYETVEEGLADQIRALDHFDDRRVSKNDWKIASGGIPHAAILQYRQFNTVRDSYDQVAVIQWTIRIHLLVRYTDDTAANNNMRDRRDEIITRIFQNPRLPDNEGVDTAFDSLPSFGSLAEDEVVEIGGVKFLQEFIDVVIEERVTA